MRLKNIIIAIVLLLSVPSVAQDIKYSPRYYVNRAESYINSGAWNSAKREIDAGLELFPDDPELRFHNGRYYYTIDNINEARYNMVRAVQANDQLFKAKRFLVDIEEKLGHYSSAICYINELLEFQPYDRDLWRRKIAFYRRMGNDIEADAALERLSHIYPNDTLVVNDVRRRNRESWDEVLRKSSLYEAADNLEMWIDKDPRMREYYIELISTYSKMGEYEKAIGAGNRGLQYFPNDQEMINKVAGIMSEMGLFSQALTLVKGKNLEGSAIYNNLLYEASNDARIHDAYEVNGRLYLSTGDRDALNYLINTSMARGYYEDARYYLEEAIRLDGRTIPLLIKLYTVEKMTGNDKRSLRLLAELYEMNPDDELVETYGNLMVELARKDMGVQQWNDARQHLDRAILVLTDTAEIWPSVVTMQITVLGHLNRFSEARGLYLESSEFNPDQRERFASAYEEVAGLRLKYLVEEERYPAALDEARDLLEVIPESEAGLRCAINMSQTLKKDEEFMEYARKGYETYPDVPYFIVKQALSLQMQGREASSLALLRPARKGDEYINPQLTAAHSGISQEWATELIKDRMPDIALEVLDTALVYDPDNRELMYTKGLAYESLKDYTNAREFQMRNYNPSNAEQEEFVEHMRYLAYKGYSNSIEVSNTHAFYDSRDCALVSIGHLYSIASISYSHIGKRNAFTGQISYKGIDGVHNSETDEPGGFGLEFMGQLEHEFNSHLSGMANLSLSTRFFNKVGANVSLSYTTLEGWTPALRLGYRHTPSTYIFLGGAGAGQTAQGEFDIYLFSPSLGKAWERISLTANTDLTLLSNDLYYNVGLKGKFLINDDNTSSVSVITGFGSFPELSFFEQTALKDVSHTNAMVGFDIQYLLTNQLCLGVTGSWNTCYNPIRLTSGQLRDSYRNIFSIALQAHIAF